MQWVAGNAMVFAQIQKHGKGMFLFLSGLLGLAAGYFCAVLLGTLLQPGPPKPLQRNAPPPRAERRPVLKDFQGILKRDIFNSAGGHLSFAPERPGKPAAAASRPGGGDWTLVGTVSGGRNPLAAITSGGKTRTYRLDAKLPGGAKLTKIERSRVTLTLADGRRQVLELPKKKRQPTGAKRTAGIRAQRARPTGRGEYQVRRLDGNRWQIPRSSAEKARANIGELLKQARVEPFVVNGTTEGFVIKMIRPGSLFSQIGLKVGDVLHEINGVPLQSPEKALQVFQQLRQARQINIALERQDKPMTFSYEIE